MGRYHSLNKNFEASPKIGEKLSAVWTGIPEDDNFSGTNLDMCRLFLETMVIAVAVSCEK